MSNEENVIKIILLGEQFVGKTCLINAYCKNEFLEDVRNTISASCINKEIETSKGKFTLKMWGIRQDKKNLGA